MFYWIVTAANGKWSQWGQYGRCSKTCGPGIRTKRRVCNNPKPVNGGLSCQGAAVHQIKCNVKSCSKFVIMIKLSIIYCNISSILHMNEWICFIFIACFDRYPTNMACKIAFSCTKLRAKSACNKKFSQVLPRWCWINLSGSDRQQPVKRYCRKSCRNCIGAFWNMLNIRILQKNLINKDDEPIININAFFIYRMNKTCNPSSWTTSRNKKRELENIKKIMI